MKDDSKRNKYIEMVLERKACRRCENCGLTNPSVVDNGKLDGIEIGPWTRWNGDLNARILIVGQEWGDVASFERQGGLDTPSATNEMLLDLLGSVGISLQTAPSGGSQTGVFLTNAALCLKRGGAQAKVNSQWFSFSIRIVRARNNSRTGTWSVRY